MIFLYGLILIVFAVYSYSLIDPNITFFQSKLWESYREYLVYFGYYRRDLSWLVYLILVIFLFIFHYLLVKNYRKINLLKTSLLIGTVLLFSYSFLSHDLINYMFDAKIVTFYQQNPYLHKALDFPNDQWLRFMHWTHRTYPYGPVFLIITLIPSLLSFGKFALSFFLFKATFSFFYLIAIYFLNKIDKKQALLFATHPLIIVEGLINAHNDIIAVSIGIIGIYYLLSKKEVGARLFFLLSGGIKFLTFPIIFTNNSKTDWNKIIFGLTIAGLVYLSVKSEVQPWYYLNLLIFLPFFSEIINKINIFFFGLLISYYPYIRLGGWDSSEKINLKHRIIAISIIINLIYLFFLHQKIIIERKKIKSK